MLQLTIPSAEYYDEKRETFIEIKGQTVQLEHSLVSVSKWEAKWKKPFLGKDPKTEEESLDYIRCMTITQNVDPNVYKNLTPPLIAKINAYIEEPMTATWFSESQNQRPSREIITAEIIYYWMIALNIPMECQKWHLNRLLTLIRVCNIKNGNAGNKPKMSKRELMNRNRALNAARKSRLNTNG